jgi:hypothetical protein
MYHAFLLFVLVKRRVGRNVIFVEGRKYNDNIYIPCRAVYVCMEDLQLLLVESIEELVNFNCGA